MSHEQGTNCLCSGLPFQGGLNGKQGLLWQSSGRLTVYYKSNWVSYTWGSPVLTCYLGITWPTLHFSLELEVGELVQMLILWLLLLLLVINYSFFILLYKKIFIVESVTYVPFFSPIDPL